MHPTAAQPLGALLKSARDIMRKDKGLNGDLDRLPMLTWIMFLKFLDDLEIQREGEAKLAGKNFEPAHRTDLNAGLNRVLFYAARRAKRPAYLRLRHCQ